MGKTSLIRRVLGQPFTPAYQPTVAGFAPARFFWKDKSGLRVEVEIVEVVEGAAEDDDDVPAAARQKPSASKGGAFAGATAVVLMFDARLRPTFDAAEKLAAAAPPSLPLLLLSNFRDAPDAERAVHREDVEAWVRRMRREAGETRMVHGIEASMADLFGLKSLHAWFEIPFCSARLAAAEAAAAEAARGVEDARTVLFSTQDSFALLYGSTAADYAAHKALQEERKRAAALAAFKSSTGGVLPPDAAAAAAALELEALRKRVAELEAKCSAAAAAAAKNKGDAEGLVKEVEALKAEGTKLKQERKGGLDQISSLQQQVDAKINSNLKERKELLDKHQKEIEKREALVAALQAEVQALRGGK